MTDRHERRVPERDFFSPAAVARLLGISPAHARRLIATGALVAANLGTGSRPLYVVPRCELLALLRARGLDRLGDGASGVLRATDAQVVTPAAAGDVPE